MSGWKAEMNLVGSWELGVGSWEFRVSSFEFRVWSLGQRVEAHRMTRPKSAKGHPMTKRAS